ncbi:MAG TPA: PQQ-binding-like beta-propeller repeat protein [Planctomycetota bacterium]|nr:PQQ-binding-like beta-propeller repeat protein [Planctomycetota bacterium]
MVRRLVVATVLVSCVASAAEADWPQWRGPGRDGIALGATLPGTLPASLKQVWEVEVGAGYPGPVIAGDSVVIFSRQGDNEAIRCLNAADGKERWKDEYPAPYKPESVAKPHGKGPFATPTIAGGKVFAIGISGVLSAYDLASGKKLWRHDFKGQFKKTYPSWGASCSPLVEGSLCILGVGAKDQGGLAAFDVQSGKVVWQQTADGAAYSSPVAADIAGQRQIIALMEHHLLAVEPKEGKVLWKVPLVVQYEQNIFTPIVHKDLVIVAGWGQPIRAYRIAMTDGALAAVEAWKSDREAFFMSTPVLTGGHLYGLADRGRGTLVCIKAEDGITAWSSPGGQGQYASLVAAGDKVLALTTKGELSLFAADASGFKELGRVVATKRTTWAHLALVGNGLYVKDNSHAACFDLKGE